MTGAKGGCDPLDFGTYDPFRQTTELVPISTQLDVNFVKLGASVSINDCEQPVVLLKSSFFSKYAWLGLERVGVVSDGKLIFQADIPAADVRRDLEPYGREETAVHVLSATEAIALQSINKQSRIIVRYTGTSGFVTLDKDATASFQDAIIDATATAKIVENAIAPASPAWC